MRANRKSHAARPQEGGRHAVSKFRRSVSMEITVEDNKRCKISAEIKRFKKFNKRRGVNKTKRVCLNLV